MNAGRTNDGPPCDSLFFALSLVMFLFTTVVLYAIALQLVHALPVVKRIVISPPITSPNAGTVWTPGKSQLVTWYDDLHFHASVYTIRAHLTPP